MAKSTPTPETPDYLKKNDGHTVITLNRPAKINGVDTKQLTMREPTVGDQLASEKMNDEGGEADCAYIANLCAITPDELKSLTLRDFKRLKEAFQDFID